MIDLATRYGDLKRALHEIVGAHADYQETFHEEYGWGDDGLRAQDQEAAHTALVNAIDKGSALLVELAKDEANAISLARLSSP